MAREKVHIISFFRSTALRAPPDRTGYVEYLSVLEAKGALRVTSSQGYATSQALQFPR